MKQEFRQAIIFNKKVLLVSFCSCVLLVVPSVHADSSIPLPLGSYSGELRVDKISSTIVITKTEGEFKIPEEVPNPPRLLIDLPSVNKKVLKEKIIPVPQNSCVEKVRIGNHPDKIRVVVDLEHQKGKPNCSIRNHIQDKKLTISISKSVNSDVDMKADEAPLVPVQSALHTPTAIPTQTPTITATMNPTVVVASTPTHTNTPTATPTTTTIPTKTITPQKTSLPIINKEDPVLEATTSAPEVSQPALLGIDFVHQGKSNQVILRLTERFSFRMSKEATRKYKISINGVSLAHKGLLLPQFPPNEVAGFTLVRAQESSSGVVITIAVDDGMKATAVNVDSSIVISADTAGF